MTRRRLGENNHRESSDVKSADGLKRSGTDVMEDLQGDITRALGDSLAVHLRQAKAGFQRCGRLDKQEMS